MKNGNEVKLKVAEARSRDVGRGIARIDPEIVEALGLTTGDVIVIDGTKRQRPCTGQDIRRTEARDSYA